VSSDPTADRVGVSFAEKGIEGSWLTTRSRQHSAAAAADRSTQAGKSGLAVGTHCKGTVLWHAYVS
jgi:hypothetical protein